MKPPFKSFTVEVRRSRSGSSAVRPNESKVPLFNEFKPPSSSVPTSQARQLAERMFTSLTARSGAGLETKTTVESVFGAVTPQAAVVETPAAETVAIPAETLYPSVEDMVPAKPRRPRAGKVRTSIVPSTKVVKPKASAAVKPAVHIAPMHPLSNVHDRESVAPIPPVKIDQVHAASLAADAELQERQNWGWRPGERWKRRLRHLR